MCSEVAKEMREVDAKIGEFVERKVTAEDQLKRIDIRAPQDGTVFQSTVHTVGGVITGRRRHHADRAGSRQLAVEAKVNPQDIDQVQVGQTAVLRFSALQSAHDAGDQRHRSPAFRPTPRPISAPADYYVTRIAMPKDEIARLGDVKLVPGMPVEAFVQTGERSVLSYLVKPLQDQFMRTFREK